MILLRIFGCAIDKYISELIEHYMPLHLLVVILHLPVYQSGVKYESSIEIHTFHLHMCVKYRCVRLASEVTVRQSMA